MGDVAIGAGIAMAGAIPEIDGTRADALPIEALLASGRPAVLRGVARDWGLVRKARIRSPRRWTTCAVSTTANR